MRDMYSPIDVREAACLFGPLCRWKYNICNLARFRHENILTNYKEIWLRQERPNTRQIRQTDKWVSSGYPKHLNRAFFNEIQHALDVRGLSPSWNSLDLNIPDVCDFLHMSWIFVIAKSWKLAVTSRLPVILLGHK
jgi:hypothetical protein